MHGNILRTKCGISQYSCASHNHLLGETRFIPMAQWAKQFTGNTHETKVEDIQNSLTRAVESLRSATEADEARKGKSVIHLAERLLAARKKMLGVRILKLRASMMPEDEPKNLHNLLDREKQLGDNGIQGILIEFGVVDLAVKLEENR